ncbi:MAG: hypothetical protein ACRDQB_06540, partial [Thermocrispum sp.]
MGYTANDIAAMTKAGRAEPYQTSASEAKTWADAYAERSSSFAKMLGRLESAWEGDGGDAAKMAIRPIVQASETSAENTRTYSGKMDEQASSFTALKGSVGDGPGPKPESTFAGDYLPVLTDNDEQVEAWNEKAQQVVDDYNGYRSSTEGNVLPASYGSFTSSPEGLKFSVDESGGGGKGTGNGFVGGTGSTGTSSSSSGVGGVGSGGSGASPGSIGTSPSSGAGGSGGVGGGIGGPGGLRPGGSTGASTGLPPGAVRLPDGSIRYADGTVRTPDGRLISP